MENARRSTTSTGRDIIGPNQAWFASREARNRRDVGDRALDIAQQTCVILQKLLILYQLRLDVGDPVHEVVELEEQQGSPRHQHINIQIEDLVFLEKVRECFSFWSFHFL